MFAKRDDAAACWGLANANDKSIESSEGPFSLEFPPSSSCGVEILEDACGDLGFAGWNLHTVINFLKSGVLVDATALSIKERNEVNSTLVSNLSVKHAVKTNLDG